MRWKVVLTIMAATLVFIFLTVATMQAMHEVESVIAMGISNMHSVLLNDSTQNLKNQY
jgi:hypothetical protein